MSIDYSKNNSNWINGFTKDQFDIFIKEFIKIFFNVENVVLIDGKGDGGSDIKILDDEAKKKKIPIQITTDKSVYYKLKKDLPKIAKQISDHGYSDSFYFFYSSSSAESNIDDLIDEARDLGFTLFPFDSKMLGEYTQKPKYSKLRAVIRQVLGPFLKKEDEYFDKYDKMKFDLVCYSDDSFQIKNRTITAFILFELHNSETGLSSTEIKLRVKEKFQLHDDVFIERMIERLMTEKKLIIINQAPITVNLSPSEKGRIDAIKDDIDFQEQFFINSISELLTKAHLQDKIKEIVEEIYELYKSNYIKDYLEINEITDNGGFVLKMIDDFEKYLTKLCGGLEINSKQLSHEILEICNYNNFLQKLGAGQLFTKLVKNTEIDQYLNRQPKTVYLDASVLIYIVCYLIDEHSEYSNIYFQVAKDLMKYHKNGKTQINLFVSKNYVQETALHLQSAVHLAAFTRLPVFSKLGSSSNIYYNFFLHQKKNDELKEEIETFEDYLNNIGIRVDGLTGEQLFNYLIEFLQGMLEDSGINVFDFYPYYVKQRKKFEEIEKELAHIYGITNTIRTNAALTNDALMLCELNDEEVKKTDPTFLTFDNSFYHFRKRYHKIHPLAPYWYLYRPAKYLDHLSLINFTINSDALVKDIFTIIEDEFDIQHKVKYLNDALTRLVDLKTASGIKLTTGLAEIRENDIFSIEKEEKERTSYRDTQPIDDFFIDLSKYYADKKGKYDFAIFKEFLAKEEIVDKVLNYFITELPTYVRISGNDAKLTIFQKMDTIIDISLEVKTP